jgi:DNA polymerase-3 subunit chi
MAEALDEAIWQITPFSFIPHHLDNEGPNPPAPIILSAGGKRPFYFDILFNASNHIAPFHDKFKHIIEIVPNCDDAKQGLREKFKQYRQAQWLVETESLMTMTDKAPYAIQET